MTSVIEDRYSRQMLFSGVGVEGQSKIEGGQVAVIGCGALGTVSAEMLTRAGVGRLTIIDRDFVETSNLQRQSLFTEEDARLALPKAVVAEKALIAMNSQVQVRGVVQDVCCGNIEELCQGAQVIVDGTDNFETRYLLNDFCVKWECPWLYGACVGSYGTAFAFRPQHTPCLRCLFETPPTPGTNETCDTAGILASVVHIVASYQVTQVLKLLVGQSPSAQLLKVDVWQDVWRTIRAGGARNHFCPCCGKRQFRFLEGKEQNQLTRLCGRNAVQISPGRPSRLNFEELSQRLRKTGKVDFNPYMMRIQVNGYEIALFPDGRSIIRGTEDFSQARAVYARYIGN